MGSVLLHPAMSNHPAIRKINNRAVTAWVSSLLWCSRNGRVDHFPQNIVREFATPAAEKALGDAWLWVEWGDTYVLPERTPGSGLQLWKFGPSETARPHIPESLRRAVYERDGYACLHCGAADRLSLDHIHPFSRGGADTLDNLQTLCRPCNSRKGARV